MPAQGPGSPAGASYTYRDTNVSSSQAYWYWLEHVSLGGATTLAGSVSVIYQAPTAVTLSGIDASPATPLALPGALPVALASLAALVVTQSACDGVADPFGACKTKKGPFFRERSFL